MVKSLGCLALVVGQVGAYINGGRLVFHTVWTSIAILSILAKLRRAPEN